MPTKAAAAVVPPTSSEREAAINRSRAMREIMDNLDTKGELSKWLAEYSRTFEKYSGARKSQSSRAAKKK